MTLCNSSVGILFGILWSNSFAISELGTYRKFKRMNQQALHGWNYKITKNLMSKLTSSWSRGIALSTPGSILARTSFIAAHASSRQLCGAPFFRIPWPNTDCQQQMGQLTLHLRKSTAACLLLIWICPKGIFFFFFFKLYLILINNLTST